MLLQVVKILGDHVIAEILVNKRFGNNSIYSDRLVRENFQLSYRF